MLQIGKRDTESKTSHLNFLKQLKENYWCVAAVESFSF